MRNKACMGVLFYGCIAAAILIIIFSAVQSDIEQVAISNESLMDFSTGWQVSIDGQAQGIMDLPATVSAGENAVITIQNMIPEQLKQNSTLLFRSSQSFVKIFIGDKLLSSFGYESHQAFGNSPGSAWQIVRIPIEDFGKQIVIQSISPYPKYAKEISPVYIGTKAAIVFYILGKNLGSVLVSLLIFMIGIFMVVIFGFTKNYQSRETLLHLGLFSILLSIWCIGESKILQLFFGNTFVITNVVFLSLLVLPIPFLLFLSAFGDFRQDKGLRLFVWLFSLNFLVVSLLQFLDISDYFSTLPSVQLLIVVAILYILGRYLFFYRKGAWEDLHIVTISMGALMLFSILAVISFYYPSMMESNALIGIGFLIFIASSGIWAGKQALLSLSYKIEQETLKTLAYSDILTSLPNRLAFEEHMGRYRRGEIPNGAILLMFDLNNLKEINDKQTHCAGDRALVDAASLLQACFSPIGDCYRIGGDEFCAICGGVSQERVAQAEDLLQKRLGEMNQTRDTPLSIAYGSARYEPTGEKIDQVLNLADTEMYQCKARMKGLR